MIKKICKKILAKDIIKSSRRILYGFKLKVLFLMALGFVGSVLEGIGINAIIPLLSFLTGANNHGEDFISKTMKSAFNSLGIDFSLKQILIFISLLFLAKMFINILLAYAEGKILSGYEEKTRNRLYKRLMQADWPYLIKQKLGYIEAVLKNDIAKSSSLLRRISITASVLLSLVVYTTIAINISAKITLITMGLGFVLFIILKPLIAKGKAAAQEEERLNKKSAHFINENVLGLKSIKTSSSEDAILKRSAGFFAQFKHLKVRMAVLGTLSTAILQPISIIFIGLIFAISFKMPNFNFAAMIAIVYLIQKIFQYIQSLQANLYNLHELAPYAQSIINFEDEAAKNREKNEGRNEFQFEKKLAFQDVTFSYAKDTPVLKNINIEIKKGEMIGLIGSSGSGKTTLVDLILRLLKPTSGAIKIDGENINEMDIKNWRKSIGYISQDMFLINDTIENNIRFYDESISKESIVEASKKANIYDTIISFPNGFATQIGERGIMLSGGQRQRIIIARILARNPRILVMDEATSALDNESEEKIKQVIEKLKGEITVIIVAHRLSTIKNSDKIFVIENGKISEQGLPEELLKDKKSYFYKMYNIRNSE